MFLYFQKSLLPVTPKSATMEVCAVPKETLPNAIVLNPTADGFAQAVRTLVSYSFLSHVTVN